MRSKPGQKNAPPAAPAPPPPDTSRKRRWLRIGLGLVAFLLFGLAAYLFVLSLLARRHLRAAEQAVQRRDFAQAGAHLADYLRLKPDDTDVRLLAARTARRGGDFDGAVR